MTTRVVTPTPPPTSLPAPTLGSWTTFSGRDRRTSHLPPPSPPGVCGVDRESPRDVPPTPLSLSLSVPDTSRSTPHVDGVVGPSPSPGPSKCESW